jgi:hypothetical protein
MPSAPPGWDRTIDDLLAELARGERRTVGSPETEWAREYERSLIPADSRIPQDGDTYEALSDIEVKYLVYCSAPASSGGKGLLKRGERVRIDQKPGEPRPISVSFKAIETDVEARLIPADLRTDPQYRGFELRVRMLELLTRFRLVSEIESK